MIETDSKQEIGLSPVRTPTSDGVGEGVTIAGTLAQAHYNETKRGLSPRHVQLMAIGGSIGTGLWVCRSPSNTHTLASARPVPSSRVTEFALPPLTRS